MIINLMFMLIYIYQRQSQSFWMCLARYNMLRIDTGDLGVNGGACFMHLVIFYCIKYLYVLGVII